MEQIVRVRQIFPDGTAQVMHIRESACSGDCHKCSGCGAAKEAMIFTAHNAISARPGDLVKVESETGPVLKAAVVLYMVPLALFFLGYWLGTLSGSFGVLGGILGFVLGVALVVWYDRKCIKEEDFRYTITAYAGDSRIQSLNR